MMKKTRIAFAVVVIIGLGWLGATWYTGKQIETQLHQNLAQANQTLSKLYPGVNLVLDSANYQRGIFSSTANIALYTANTQASPLIFHETISHGPFPLIHFTKNWLKPVMAEVKTELLHTPESQLLFSATDGKTPINALTRIDFDASNRTVVTVPSLHIQGEGVSIYSGGTHLNLQSDSGAKLLSYAVSQQNLVIEFIDDSGIKNKLTSAGFIFNVKSQQNRDEATPNEQYFHSPFVNFDVDNRQLFSMKNFNYQTQVSAKDQQLGLQLNYQCDELSYLNQIVGKIDLALSAFNLPTAAIAEFMTHYKDLLSPLAEKNSTTMPSNSMDILKILGKHPTLNLDKFRVSNSKGTSNATFHATAKDLNNLVLNQQTLASLIQKHVTHLDWNIDINPGMAEEFLRFIQMSDSKLTKEQAEEVAVKQLQIFRLAAQMTGLTQLGSDEIKSTLNYDSKDDSVNLNGKTGKLQEFIKY